VAAAATAAAVPVAVIAGHDQCTPAIRQCGASPASAAAAAAAAAETVDLVHHTQYARSCCLGSQLRLSLTSASCSQFPHSPARPPLCFLALCFPAFLAGPAAAAAAAHSQDQPLCFPPYFQLPPLLASLRHHPCHQLHKSQHENRPLSHSPPLLHPCYPLCHRRPFHAHCHLHHHACASLPQLSP